MNRRKILCVALFATLGLSVVLAISLCLSRNVFHISEYLGLIPPGESGGESVTPGSEDGNAEEGTPGAGKDSSASDAPPAGVVTDKDAPGPSAAPSVRIGVEVTSSTELPEVRADGTTHVHEVSLPEEALDWSKPGRLPQVGDNIEVSVLPGRVYQFEVSQVNEYETPERKVEVYGNLKGTVGPVIMKLFAGKMLLQITDDGANKVYNLYFAADRTTYIVQEIDSRSAMRNLFQPLTPTSGNSGN